MPGFIRRLTGPPLLTECCSFFGYWWHDTLAQSSQLLSLRHWPGKSLWAQSRAHLETWPLWLLLLFCHILWISQGCPITKRLSCDISWISFKSTYPIQDILSHTRYFIPILIEFDSHTRINKICELIRYLQSKNIYLGYPGTSKDIFGKFGISQDISR